MKNENKKRKNSKRNSSSKETKQRGVIRANKNSQRVAFTSNQIKQFYKEFLNEEKNYNSKKRSTNTRGLKKTSAAKRSKNNSKKKTKSKRTYYRQSKLVQKTKVYKNYYQNKKTKVRDSIYRLSTAKFIDLVDDNSRIIPYEEFEELATDNLLPQLLKITKKQKKWPRFFHLMIEFFDGFDFTFFSGPLVDGFQEDIRQAFYSLLEDLYSKLPKYIAYLPSMNVTGFRFILYPIGYRVNE